MKAFMGYHDEAQKAVAQGQNWVRVRDATSDIQTALRGMKFEVPENEGEVSAKVCYVPSLTLREILTIRSMRRFSRACRSGLPRFRMSRGDGGVSL